jgi:phenylacetate-coenzyme A ligase PaaK-like adenylate-forming protein
MIGVRESLLGPGYFYHRDLINRSRGWSPSQIREYQEKRVRRLVRRYGDEITQKDDYDQNLARYTRWDLPLLAHTVRTGGTSGQPLRFTADTFTRRQKERAYLFDIWSQVGYLPYDLRVRYAGDVRGGMVHYNRLENVWIVSPAETVDEELGRLRRWLRTLPPFFLHVYPSSLFTFIDLVGEDLFRSLPVRGVIAASEMFPASEQAQFEQEFGLAIAHWYGHSEYATLAYCCRKCRGFHFYPTYGYVELLPSEVEGCRRVVASSFNRIGTQFVRYDTGDLALDQAGSCATDNFPRASAIVGRSQETFVDNSGRRRSLFGYAFGDLDHDAFYDQIRDIQFVQDKVGSLRIRIVTNPGAERDQIQRIFERRIPMASLQFEYVSVIERSPSGKRRYFVDGLHAGATGNSDSGQEIGPPPAEIVGQPVAGNGIKPSDVVVDVMDV